MEKIWFNFVSWNLTLKKKFKKKDYNSSKVLYFMDLQ